MKNRRVLVSIVNYHSTNDIFNLLHNFSLINIPHGYDLSFLIIDNHSSPLDFDSKYADFINKYSFSHINDLDSYFCSGNFVFYSENNGFGAGHNLSLKFASRSDIFDAVWLLNTDLTLELNAFSAFVPYIENDSYHVLGSVVIEGETSLYGTVNIDGFKGYGSAMPDGVANGPLLVDAVIGTSMILKRSCFDHAFDETFFMYVEENELCYRLSTLGLLSHTILDSVVNHIGGKTFGSHASLRWYYKVRNLLHFKRSINKLNYFLVIYLFLITVFRFPFKFDFYLAWFLGVRDFFRGVRGKYLGDLL